MFLTGVGTSLPPNRYTQKDCWEAIQSSSVFPKLNPRSRAVLKKVLLGNNGIDTRHFVLERLAQAFELTPEIMQERFATFAPTLATTAARQAMRHAGISAAQVDALLISTCTGYLCPGLTSYVSESLGLCRDVLTLDLVGQGCGAALPNIRAAEALLASQRCRHVVSVCVEVCSAAFYLDEDPGVLISACLFGDGAGAVVLTSEPGPALPCMEWIDAASVLLPGDRDLLRFDHAHGMLRNILTPEVPALAAQSAHSVFDLVRKKTGITRDQIKAWIWHAGGRDVLTALQHQFQLPESALARSASVLREVGNISSPFVLHVLEKALSDRAPEGYWWMSTFGAGFSCHGALWKVASSPGASVRE